MQSRFLRRPLCAALVAALGAAPVLAAEQSLALSEVTVTGTREGQRINQTAAAVGVVGDEALRLVKPSHPSQIIGQVPGAAIAVTNGEGHTTAIRQPFTTAPVYLFLEDGIPIRSTGFFNHNALYEVNLPQAGAIEVSRGPGSALYGSDAIGGVVNVLTRTPPGKTEFSALGEVGSFGWRRLLGSGGSAAGDDAWRGDANLTHTDGWRAQTAYDRQSVNLRWDRAIGDHALLKTVFSNTRVDQETGANSPLIERDYRDNPTLNYKPIAFRKVRATRLSTSYEREEGDTLLTLTPYFRDDGMDLLASFNLASDPTLAKTRNQSYGLQAKWRRDYPQLKARLIAGVDLDYSPGGREENRLALTTSGAGATRQYSAYTVGARVYDYDVSFRGVSPYLQGEIAASDSLRFSAGLRYDQVGYRFENRLAAGSVAAGGTNYGQAGNASIDYGHLSPKLGAVWTLAPQAHLYGSLNHGFRAPSESQLFRPSPDAVAARAVAAAQSALGLKPVKVDQVELGLRGQAGALSYDVTAYVLDKRDDILTYTDPVTNIKSSSNNGRTRHRGIELALGMAVAADWRADLALSKAVHRYVDWVVPGAGNFSGFEMEAAPRSIANLRLSWTPATATTLQLEWVHLGSYWLDQANTAKYNGHDLLNLRGTLPLGKGLTLSGSVNNLADRRYADSAQISSGVPVFSPGLPRSALLALEAKW